MTRSMETRSRTGLTAQHRRAEPCVRAPRSTDSVAQLRWCASHGLLSGAIVGVGSHCVRTNESVIEGRIDCLSE